MGIYDATEDPQAPKDLNLKTMQYEKLDPQMLNKNESEGHLSSTVETSFIEGPTKFEDFCSMTESKSNKRVFFSRSVSENKYCPPRKAPPQRSSSDLGARRNSVPSFMLADCLNFASFRSVTLEDIPQCCRVRNFAISSKGQLLNRGDSFKLLPVQGLTLDEVVLNGNVNDPTSTQPKSRSSSCSSSGVERSHNVTVLGESGVGRSLLIRQFCTSEYLGAFDHSDDDNDIKVSVLMDDEETDLSFDCSPFNQNRLEEEEESTPDAYVIVYSVADRSSFQYACDVLYSLRKENHFQKAIILVGNKSDLARARVVSTEEGHNVAVSYDCKFVETSAVLNHQVDELLAGVIRQIKLKEQQVISDNSSPVNQAYGKDRRSSLSKSAKNLFDKLLKRNSSISSSAGDLYSP
ncbi:GTP-binding protein REM 1 [Lingula anatina]|uniref:GTP-binding protein REM 1 n=1 Tax=Lingula anatina TaxID=7574 RepID=A0A1S3J4D8_LINAN|nr:GTP-binding protein REM 1 [Lingula anatina]|eukprot:XP_013405250.1 GTP-binding protein REM 1 [Lingula anatina]